MPSKVLVVDDDPNIREVIAFALQKAGYTVEFSVDGSSGLQHARQNAFDLIVLDIGLPEMDGLEVCREFRKSSDVPILFLTARDEEIDRVLGLEIGGDDYVTKPFSPRELVARIKAILKRTKGQQVKIKERQPLRHGKVELDTARHFCAFDGRSVALTASEFALLEHMLERPQVVLSRQSLIDAIYGPNIHVSDRTVDSHIRNIRRKLAEAGCAESIATVHGVGLRMGSCQ
ncbi:response regulator [Epibacterium sp. SM1979]|uniref:Response regulator n=1 Tax=Tritonibacter litoralis TaxID=2662264 RepID=A0A843YN92_9RHOB|nr:response regulator transcription factor [Tritonibacter litoralis]MQQ10643.1 response regulator [Tritonibacter litoralis]